MPNFKKGGGSVSKSKPPMAAKSSYTIGKPTVGGTSSKGKSEGGSTSGRDGANIKFNRKS